MLLQPNPVLAGSDDLLQREIEGGIAESRELRDTQIKVHVEERLVVLAAHFRLYKQKMIGERIAWTKRVAGESPGWQAMLFPAPGSTFYLLACQLQALSFHGGHRAG